MWMRKGSNRRFIFVTRENEMNLKDRADLFLARQARIVYFRLCSGVFSMTGDDDDLVEIAIGLVIIRQKSQTPLKKRMCRSV